MTNDNAEVSRYTAVDDSRVVGNRADDNMVDDDSRAA
ncbi:hypothetical protein M892_20525 [Vibrio campbellii ATCC BAA-1116]|uniref:Uncharacterized protein n=1 Tax=Vibrio campbellii (strain ATCC BAA-1116) TaxID=2902295 RepID=A7N6F2_VIBC1|nr:hypothetical protein VIBHAR_06323 [Vibrio campbellii ATCC BAA-1116]AGU98378.1 hypothetical protein M892_20525 [Vibrio campbellii ATCC BAA-1116]